MSDPKPLASLSGSLLARKGQAAPAMRRQGAGGFSGLSSSPAVEAAPEDHVDDLGWNDMGHDRVPHGGYAGLSPMGSDAAEVVQAFPESESEESEQGFGVVPPVVQQQRELAQEYAPVEPAPATVTIQSPIKRAAPGSRGKAAFTLRLDSERHLKLRLVCALRHRSAQHIVTEALDAFLAKQPIPSELAQPSQAASGGDQIF